MMGQAEAQTGGRSHRNNDGGAGLQSWFFPREVKCMRAQSKPDLCHAQSSVGSRILPTEQPSLIKPAHEPPIG